MVVTPSSSMTFPSGMGTATVSRMGFVEWPVGAVSTATDGPAHSIP